jgi:hypothetical protein
MQPCSLAQEAKPFWRVAGALNGFGPVIRTIRPEGCAELKAGQGHDA